MYQCMAENSLGSSFGSSTLHVEPRQVTAKDTLGVRAFSHRTHFRDNDIRTIMRQPEGNKYKKFGKAKGKIERQVPKIVHQDEQIQGYLITLY